MLSIVIPAYNTHQYLPCCLESILGSDLVDYEIVLVDDGSTDGTGSVCDAYAATHDCIRTFHTDHVGVSTARNYGFKQCHGDYVAFFDSDDTIEPSGWQELMQTLASDGSIDVALYAFTIVEKDGTQRTARLSSADDSAVHTGVDVLYDLLDAPVSIWNKVYRTSLIANLEFDKTLRYAEDAAFTFAVAMRCRASLIWNKPLYTYRRRASSTTGRGLDAHWRDALHANRQIFDSLKTIAPTVGMARCFTTVKGFIANMRQPSAEFFQTVRSTLSFGPSLMVRYVTDPKLRTTPKQHAVSAAIWVCPRLVWRLNRLKVRLTDNAGG